MLSEMETPSITTETNKKAVGVAETGTEIEIITVREKEADLSVTRTEIPIGKSQETRLNKKMMINIRIRALIKIRIQQLCKVTI